MVELIIGVVFVPSKIFSGTEKRISLSRADCNLERASIISVCEVTSALRADCGKELNMEAVNFAVGLTPRLDKIPAFVLP